MPSTKLGGRLSVMILTIFLTACAGATLIGAGCATYAKARLDMPAEDLRASPPAVRRWIDALDAGMTEACTRR